MTNRRVLGPIREEDRDLLFDWINDRETAILSNEYQPVHEFAHKDWLASFAGNANRRVFAIRSNEDKLVGVCQLADINPVSRSAELRIRIGNEVDRGQGLGKAAVSQLLEFAFHDLNLSRVFLNVYASNEAAVQLYEGLGFRHEGRLVEADYVDGAYVDVLCMAMLAREFKLARS